MQENAQKNRDENRPELISPNGTLRMPSPAGLPPVDNYVGPARSTETTFACGHTGPMFYAMTFYGVTIVAPPEHAEDKDECADCVKARMLKGKTRCALCGRLIVPDRPVALYRDAPGFISEALRFDHDGQTCVMGCRYCAPSEDFLVGEWNGDKFVSGMDVLREGLLKLLQSEEGSESRCASCDAEDCPGRTATYVAATE